MGEKEVCLCSLCSLVDQSRNINSSDAYTSMSFLLKTDNILQACLRKKMDHESMDHVQSELMIVKVLQDKAKTTSCS